MPLAIDLVCASERVVLDNLMHLYLHEMSRYDSIEIGDDGRFAYQQLDSYFEDDDRFPYLIRVKGKLAGFVLVRRYERAGIGLVHSVAEMFLLESYRRLGIGEEIVRHVLDSFPGRWEVAVLEENRIAQMFWRNVIYRYTGNNFSEHRVPGWEGPVFDFASPGTRPFVPEKQPQGLKASRIQPQTP